MGVSTVSAQPGADASAYCVAARRLSSLLVGSSSSSLAGAAVCTGAHGHVSAPPGRSWAAVLVQAKRRDGTGDPNQGKADKGAKGASRPYA